MRPCLRERILKRRTIYKSNSSETSELLKQAQFYIALIAKYVTWRWIVTPWQRHHWHSFPPSHKFEPSLDNDDSTSKNSTEHHSLEKGVYVGKVFFENVVVTTLPLLYSHHWTLKYWIPAQTLLSVWKRVRDSRARPSRMFSANVKARKRQIIQV